MSTHHTFTQFGLSSPRKDGSIKFGLVAKYGERWEFGHPDDSRIYPFEWVEVEIRNNRSNEKHKMLGMKEIGRSGCFYYYFRPMPDGKVEVLQPRPSGGMVQNSTVGELDDADALAFLNAEFERRGIPRK